MTHWHCECRGYIQNAVHPNRPAVDTWKTDNPISYILPAHDYVIKNDNRMEVPSVMQPIIELNSLNKEASKL